MVKWNESLRCVFGDNFVNVLLVNFYINIHQMAALDYTISCIKFKNGSSRNRENALCVEESVDRSFVFLSVVELYKNY